MAAASGGDGVLAAEKRLERATDGLGWAQDVVANLCLDTFGNLQDTCDRDGVRENYLSPGDHPIGVTISGPVPQGAACVWSFDIGNGPSNQTTAPCDQEVRLRVRYGRTTVAIVDVPLGDGTAQRIRTEIAVRDLLIAGLGDSIAAGEGNPDRAVELEGGFCFRRFLAAASVNISGRVAPALPTIGPAKTCEKRHCNERLGTSRRAMDESRLPSFALQLSIPHRARARDRATASCRDFGPSCLHWGDYRRRHVRRSALRRLSRVVGIETCSGTAPAQLMELRASWTRCTAKTRSAILTWCC